MKENRDRVVHDAYMRDIEKQNFIQQRNSIFLPYDELYIIQYGDNKALRNSLGSKLKNMQWNSDSQFNLTEGGGGVQPSKTPSS